MKHALFAVVLLTALFCTFQQMRYTKLRKNTEDDYEIWDMYHRRESQFRVSGIIASLVAGFMGGQLYL